MKALVGGGSCRGLLRDCETFGNIRITFVSSSTGVTRPGDPGAGDPGDSPFVVTLNKS